MNRLHILGVALLVLGGGCVDNRSMIEIDGRAAPSDPATCKFAPGGENILGPGLLDVGASMQPTYSLVLYLKNNLVDPKSISQTFLTSSKAWTANAAKVRINPSDYTGPFAPNPALASFHGENVIPLDGQTVQPAGGTSTQFVQAISGPLGAQLTTLVTPGALQTIVLGISLQGRTLDGNYLETNEWYFPVELCSGCLVAPTSCPTGQVLTNSNCFGSGQDSAPVCAAPK